MIFTVGGEDYQAYCYSDIYGCAHVVQLEYIENHAGSGCIHEEATDPKIRKPVLVLRTSTERPKAVKSDP